jgi:hypothetical protein
MPWNPAEFAAKHNKSLSPKQASQAARTANAVLHRTGNDASAIRIANAQVKKKHT